MLMMLMMIMMLIIIESVTEFSIVIGSPRAITWVSDYRCLI